MEQVQTRILRISEVIQRTGLGRATIYKQAKLGNFPQPISLLDSGRAVGWREDQVNAWINAVIQKSLK